MAREKRDWRRVVTVYAFAVATLLMLLLGVVLIGRDTTLTRNEIFSAVGLNLIASVIFAVTFSAVSGQVQNRAIEENVEESFSELSTRLMSHLSQTNALFLPLASYAALDTNTGYGDAFNCDLTRSLHRTGQITFYGPTAWFVPARLQVTTMTRVARIAICILDPRNRAAVAQVASDQSEAPWAQGMTRAAIEETLRTDLLRTVVALFEWRTRCPVEILYHDDTSVFRFIMTDDAIYLTWLRGDSSVGRDMGESYRFGPDSFFYQSQRLDIVRRSQLNHAKVTFNATDDRKVLLDHLEMLCGRPVREDEAEAWLEEYRAGTESFRSYLEQLSADG
ncbi:hypothetical protein [Micromonospora sp. Rc5]|uniref:hypothetical protein n=2 Tax=Micromonosporaceae TaxID=28056 RepID=UPI0013040A79|nr:hypothetical protein [Micromonospora sp. Rc5]